MERPKGATMTPFDAFIQFLAGFIPQFSIWWLVKGLFVLGLALYLAFAVIVIRQVGLMSRTLDGEFNLPLKFVAWIHFFVALGIFLIALLIL
ncbi:MAG: DUF5657 family protein [Microgenomates group bacterium]